MNKLDERQFFEILSHPTRRKIIRILHQGYYASYSDIKEIIGRSTGAIYHHIEKMRDLGIIQQRQTKEYELTPLGLKIVEYMDKINDEDLQEILNQSKVQKIFLGPRIAEFIKKNPIHWIFESGLLILFLTFIQIDFPIQIIGPFLIPSYEPFIIRFSIEILSFIFIGLTVELIARFVSKSNFDSSFLVMLSGLMFLPLLSTFFSFIIYCFYLFGENVPAILYWSLTSALLLIYAFLLIHLLIKIKKMSFERSIIITLVQGYILLALVFFVT
ncbi:MAG: winged helix-turn-helix domain-containing protein [Candidatus Hodarchaeales archaeon]